MSPRNLLPLLGLLLAAGCAPIERRLLFFPTHQPPGGPLTPWFQSGQLLGYVRPVAAPHNVWLMLHGNGGQASDRSYALPCFSSADAVYVMEYPGYGARRGTPSRAAFDTAAQEAYRLLRELYPGVPVCVAGESIGSGPACVLAGLDRPPDKVVLLVPFDRLSLVAQEHFPAFAVRLLLSDDWDNRSALAGYRGPIEIFGARDDTVIPVAHARALAAAVPSAKFTLIAGGHNDWSGSDQVRIQRP
jgi:pimeloyl-ACP methyl ester carboxylesterase